MSSKLKLSQLATQQVESLSKNLGLRRNIICRMAIGISLGFTEPPNDEFDVSGQEYNQSTIMGSDESMIKIMITNQYGRRLEPDKFFSTYVRLEIIRGLDIMTKMYSKINSPSEFMRAYCLQTNEMMIDY